MPTPKDVVDQYHKAFAGKDYATARSLLHDDLDFRGPIDTFTSADDLIESIQRLSPIVQDVRINKVFSEGDEVCVLYDLVTTTPAGAAPIAEWFQVRDDKIAAIKVYFDARPFAAPQ